MEKDRKWGKREHGQDGLTGEHPRGDAGQMVFAILFFAVWAVDTWLLHYTTVLNDVVPKSVQLSLALVLLALSWLLASRGLGIVFDRRHPPEGVIRKDVFSLVRHPVYLGEILLYLGLFVLSLSLAASVVMIAAMIFLHYISRYEERKLLARFGEEYAQYRREVPMWLPRLQHLLHLHSLFRLHRRKRIDQ